MIDDTSVIDYCGKSAYEKGKKCAKSFDKLFVQGNAIFALYQGSVGAYKINVVFKDFSKNAIAYAWCTCPSMSTGWDKTCKHVAGVLVAWNNRSRDFVQLVSWEILLKSASRDELIALITKTASQSIDVVNVLYQEFSNEPLFEDEELFDQSEW